MKEERWLATNSTTIDTSARVVSLHTVTSLRQDDNNDAFLSRWSDDFSLLTSIATSSSSLEQDEPTESSTVEKHFIDAKAYILAATTKDGVNL